MRLEFAAVGEFDRNLLAVLDHVIVGDDVAGLVDDEARTHRDGFARLLLAALAELIEEVAERFRKLRRIDAGGRLQLFFHRDGDDGGAHALDQIGEAERRAVFQHARRTGANRRGDGCVDDLRLCGLGGGLLVREHDAGAEAYDNESRGRTCREKPGAWAAEERTRVLHEGLLGSARPAACAVTINPNNDLRHPA